MKYLCFVFILLFIVGCTSDIVIVDDSLNDFQTQLVSENGVENIDVHLIRPRLIWHIGVSDESRARFVLDEILDFMDEDDWLDTLREEHYIIDIEVEVFDVNGAEIVDYCSNYYVPGTTIYTDDKDNEIDGFKTWYFSDGSEIVLVEGYN